LFHTTYGIYPVCAEGIEPQSRKNLFEIRPFHSHNLYSLLTVGLKPWLARRREMKEEQAEA
jgi:hypothetical protein